jgi:hypothetical protein
MQSYNYAVIGTVIFYLIMPFNYAIVFAFSSRQEWKVIKIFSFILLTVQILTFRSLKAYNEE